jgi:anti-sigma B factor antagonist
LSDDLHIQIDRRHGGAIVAVAGEIDKASAPVLRSELDATAADQGPITIDLTDVTYLDSSGVAVLFERLRQGSTRLVAGPSCHVRSVIDITGLPLEPLGDPPAT